MASDTPEYVEPAKEYLGAICRNCQRFFPIVGPLDPAQVPIDKPIKVGSRGPLKGECPHCKHQAEYPMAEIRRGRAP